MPPGSAWSHFDLEPHSLWVTQTWNLPLFPSSPFPLKAQHIWGATFSCFLHLYTSLCAKTAQHPVPLCCLDQKRHPSPSRCQTEKGLHTQLGEKLRCVQQRDSKPRAAAGIRHSSMRQKCSARSVGNYAGCLLEGYPSTDKGLW